MGPEIVRSIRDREAAEGWRLQTAACRKRAAKTRVHRIIGMKFNGAKNLHRECSRGSKIWRRIMAC